MATSTPQTTQPNNLGSHRSETNSDLSEKRLQSDETASNKNAQVDVLERESSSKTEHNSTAFRRLGKSAILTLLTTLMIIIAVVGFFGFLWFAGIGSKTWHAIMVRGWATRAISIPSLVLRAAVDFQTGIIGAMLAALALESGSVLFHDAARISTARAHLAKPRRLIFPLFSSWRWSTRSIKTDLVLASVSLLVLSTLALQFCSTILLSDLSLGSLPGLSDRALIASDLQYVTKEPIGTFPGGWTEYIEAVTRYEPRLSTWQRNPPSYPAFAEYSEPAIPQSGVDDTGVLLRAFLPYSTSESRQNLANYSGNAFVLDSRVACQSPILTDISLSVQSSAEFALMQIAGKMSHSTSSPRLFTPPVESIPFNCSFFIVDNVVSLCTVTIPEDLAAFEIFNSNRAGGLISEFANQTDPSILRKWYQNPAAFITWGTPFLVLNASSRFFSTHAPLGGGVTEPGYKGKSALWIANYTSNGSDLYQEEDDVWRRLLTKTGPANMSVSVCYTAWDTATLPVNITSTSNRSEPILRWKHDAGLYTTPDLNDYLGNKGQDKSSRGVLNLEKKTSWIPPPELARPVQVMPYVQQFGQFGPTISSGLYQTQGNWSAIFSTSYPLDLRVLLSTNNYYEDYGFTPEPIITPDLTLGWIYKSSYAASGSLARTMSSLITILSSMAYYDQMPFFAAPSNSTQIFFMTALYPQSRLGFWTVVILLAFHITMVSLVTVVFAIWSRYSFLGNHWQSVAQLYCQKTEGILNGSGLLTDREVRGHLKQAEEERVTVCVKPTKNLDRIGLTSSDVQRANSK